MAAPIFLGRWQAIRAGAPLQDIAEGPSLLELCRELARAIVRSHTIDLRASCPISRFPAPEGFEA
jgi:hypothetical protein